MRICRRSLEALAGMVILTWGVQSASAEPTVRVRGRGTIHVSAAGVQYDPRVVRGRVTDEGGLALVNKTVEIEFASGKAPQRVEVRSDTNGMFECHVPAEATDPVQIRARLLGDPFVDGAEANAAHVADSEPFSIRLEKPRDRRLDLDQPSSVITIALPEGASPNPINVDLRNEVGELLGAGTLGKSTPLSIVVPTARLGAQGYGSVRIEMSGARKSVQPIASTEVLRFRTSSVRLALDESSKEGVSLAGSIRSLDGEPLGQQAIAIKLDGTRVATVLSDDEGTFVVRPDATWPVGKPFRVAAVHESAAPWWVGGESIALTFTLPTPMRAPWWPLGAFASISIAWIAWSRNVDRQRGQETDANTSQTPPAANLAALSRRAIATSVGGTVVDEATLRPVANARITLTGGMEVVTQADALGRFLLLELPPGNHSLLAQADGYEDARVNLAIPHSGQWHGTRFTLRSLRSAALSHYRRALPGKLGPDAPEIHTPRELLDRHDTGVPGLMQTLTRVFEAAYYGAVTPTPAVVDQLRQQADVLSASVADPKAESFDGPSERSL